MLPEYFAFRGEHCETVATGTLLAARGVRHSEAMLFGLGRGLGFSLVADSLMEMPMFAGRIGLGKITENLTSVFGLNLRILSGTGETAWENLLRELGAGNPVGVQLDCYYLEYFRSKIHFSGHLVAVIGISDDCISLVDTISQGHICTTSRASFMLAWNNQGVLSRTWFAYVIEGEPLFDEQSLAIAIKANAVSYLREDTGRGVTALTAAARQMQIWLAQESARRDAPRCAKLMERGGTGGANFRKLYADFLTESNLLPVSICDDWKSIAALWSELSRALVECNFPQACSLMDVIARREAEGMRCIVDLF